MYLLIEFMHDLFFTFIEAQEAYLKQQNKEKARILQFRNEVIFFFLKKKRFF